MSNLIEEKEELFISIAKSKNLRYYKDNSKNKVQFFQIYPNNIPKEGSGGCHYEFITARGSLYLDIHIESKVKVNKNNLRAVIKKTASNNGYKSDKDKKVRPVVRIDISKLSDESIKSEFEKLYSIFQPVIEQEYQKYYNKEKETMSLNIKNIILYGSPGVGKTHNTNKLIRLIEDGNKEIFKTIKENKNSESVDIDDIKDRVKFVTFHQSFGYEDFIEGFRPNIEGNIVLSDGIFKTICQEANKDKEKNYYLVIDEINRGNISKIFGELITLLEEDKRDKLEVTLPYSKKPFKIPSNLYVIGTMNSTDKSIALIDIALRRRFTFLKMEPKSNLIQNIKARDLFEKLNGYIKKSHLGEDYQIGHSYFMGIKDDNDLDFVLKYKVEPLLEEYFYGDKDGLEKVLKIVQKKEYLNEDLQETINGDDLND